MEAVLELLKLTLPSLLVFLTAWMVLRTFLKKETDVVRGMLIRDSENKRVELLQSSQRILLPIRLQAYERMSLFCSRIEFGTLVTNTDASTQMSAEMYKTLIIMQVEEEFSHNVAQQVYMTDDLWSIILLAKKEVTQVCQKLYSDLEHKYAVNSLEGEPSATEFLEALVAYLKETPQIGYVQALKAIKTEVSVLFAYNQNNAQ